MLDREQYRVLILRHNADLRARFGDDSNWGLGGSAIGIMPSQAGRGDIRLLVGHHGHMDISDHLHPSEVAPSPFALGQASGAHPSYGLTSTFQHTQQYQEVLDPAHKVVRFMPPAPTSLNELKLAGAVQPPVTWGTQPGDVSGPSSRSWYTKRPVGALGAGMCGGSRWTDHVKAYRAKHPGMSYKQALSAASASY